MKIKNYYHKEYWSSGIIICSPEPSESYKRMVIDNFKAIGHLLWAMSGLDYKILKEAGLINED